VLATGVTKGRPRRSDQLSGRVIDVLAEVRERIGDIQAP
jgi:hypothetical protein